MASHDLKPASASAPAATDQSFLHDHHPPSTMAMATDPEKTQDMIERQDSTSGENLRLDSHGLPLVPQPSRFKDDPLVSPTHSIVRGKTY